jgi:hypothetical protein
MTMDSGAHLDHPPTHPRQPMPLPIAGAQPMTSHDAIVQARLDDFRAYADANAARHEREIESADAGSVRPSTGTAGSTDHESLRHRLGRRLVEIGTAVAGEPVTPDRGRAA